MSAPERSGRQRAAPGGDDRTGPAVLGMETSFAVEGERGYKPRLQLHGGGDARTRIASFVGVNQLSIINYR